MSEDIKIHFAELPCNVIDFGPKTSDWAKVTCGGCRLEQPMQKRPEHRVPAGVLERDALLAELDRAAAALKTLEGQVCELQERITRALSEPLADGKASPLGSDAVRVLMSVPGFTMGRRPTEPMSVAVRAELRLAGLIGSAGGLTVKGSIEKQRRDTAAMNALFGDE